MLRGWLLKLSNWKILPWIYDVHKAVFPFNPIIYLNVCQTLEIRRFTPFIQGLVRPFEFNLFNTKIWGYLCPSNTEFKFKWISLKWIKNYTFHEIIMMIKWVRFELSLDWARPKGRVWSFLLVVKGSVGFNCTKFWVWVLLHNYTTKVERVYQLNLLTQRG